MIMLAYYMIYRENTAVSVRSSRVRARVGKNQRAAALQAVLARLHPCRARRIAAWAQCSLGWLPPRQR
eukprot:COSAG06_NODE_51078_length_314_cov_1.051163_2_plen_67_part_01